MTNIISRKNFSSYILIAYFFMLPFEYPLATSFGSLLRYIAILYIPFVFIDIVRNQQERVRFDSTQLLLLLWMFYGFVSFFWAPDDKGYWQHYYLIYLKNSMMLFLVSFINYKSKEYELIKSASILGVVCIGLYIIFIPSATMYDSYEGRLLLRAGDSDFDPNYLVATFILPMAICVERFFTSLKNNKVKAAIYLVILIMLTWISLLTGSRGGILGITAMLTVSILLQVKDLRKTLSILAITTILFILLPYILETLPQTIQARFSIDSMTGQRDGGAARLLIWSYLIELISKYPIFGVGAGSTIPALKEIGFTLGAVAHNTYLALLVEYGFIGFIIFSIYLYKNTKVIRKERKGFELAALAGILVSITFLDAFTTKFFWGMLIFLTIRKNMVSEKSIKSEVKSNG
ncbi:O-antigen ligase family protein [Planococcus sp. ANT_H30]|uniref:O-antigen ligase family protein n=1 Tax=Planococcus sp. ANT_H30 TaxID=2597347 RepID=UPI0011ECC1F9|nr:O-antigen ligase family protein [Planococcus sp. ANT_H30]KAA0958751.1 O-antigen ligase family protein [Planococcus sp. ANT_H30]